MSRHENNEPKHSAARRLARPDLFTRVSVWSTQVTGGRWGFVTALAIVIVWAASGPYFHFSEVWQLVINTGTTIITFLMVFLIQNTQNRDAKALHLKLDELILAVKHARNELIDIERLTDDQLDALSIRYRREGVRNQDKLTECFAPDTPVGKGRPPSMPKTVP